MNTPKMAVPSAIFCKKYLHANYFNINSLQLLALTAMRLIGILRGERGCKALDLPGFAITVCPLRK